MKLVVNYIKHVRVFLNGEIIEPTKKKEKQVWYELPHDAYPITVDIVHYEEPWELLAYSQPTCWQAIRNCLKEGFEHPYCCLQIVSAGPFPRRMDFEVRERCVKSGFLTCKSYYFSLTNVQVPDELDIEQTYFRFISRKNQIQGYHSCTTSFSLSFRCYCQSYLAKPISQICSNLWVLQQLLNKRCQILLQ